MTDGLRGLPRGNAKRVARENNATKLELFILPNADRLGRSVAELTCPFYVRSANIEGGI